jgi:hypothetical protein
MDQRERLGDLEEGIRLLIKAALLEMQTAMPVQVVDVDLSEMTASAQPLIRALLPESIPPQMLSAIPNVTSDSDGNRWVQLPLLVKLPIIFPGGGGFTLTFPIAAGDEALAVFSSRAIDNWWLAGGIQNPIEIRDHDPSDGFLLVGPRSSPKSLANINTKGPELRNDDGTLSIAFDKTTQRVKILAVGGLYVNGVPVTVP